MHTSQSPQLRHARYIDPSVPYHVVTKTLRGQFILAPKKGIRELCAGVLAKAQLNWPSIKLYGYAFMSNHIHLMLQGPPSDFSAFMGFLKRELSRRLGQKYRLPGTLWHQRYAMSALPTHESQLKCLRYILSQGVKEGLVARPIDWPGLHCAKALLSNCPEIGEWFQASQYHQAKARNAVRRIPKKISRSTFYQRLRVQLSVLPALEEATSHEQFKTLHAINNDIIESAEVTRKHNNTKVAGIKKVAQTSIYAANLPLPPPWWTKRRRQITAWAKRLASETKRYIKRYFTIQNAYHHRPLIKIETSQLRGMWFPSINVA